SRRSASLQLDDASGAPRVATGRRAFRSRRVCGLRTASRRSACRDRRRLECLHGLCLRDRRVGENSARTERAPAAVSTQPPVEPNTMSNIEPRTNGAANAGRTEEPAAAARRTAPNTCTVIHEHGSEEIHFSRENVERLLAGDDFFWIDVDQPNEADYTILRDVFKFHPLAVEDSEKFGQRAKLDDYDDFVFFVVYGAVPDDDRLVEVHCFYTGKFLITVHRDDCPAFAQVRQRYVQRKKAVDDPGQLLYRIIDSLVDSFFPILADFDDRIDELETQTFLNASDAQLQEIFQM